MLTIKNKCWVNNEGHGEWPLLDWSVMSHKNQLLINWHSCAPHCGLVLSLNNWTIDTSMKTASSCLVKVWVGSVSLREKSGNRRHVQALIWLFSRLFNYWFIDSLIYSFITIHFFFDLGGNYLFIFSGAPTTVTSGATPGNFDGTRRSTGDEELSMLVKS